MVHEINERIERFQALMKSQGMNGALIVQNAALYYLTLTYGNAYLWIPASDQPLLMVLPSIKRVPADALIEQTVYLESLSQLPDYLNRHVGSKTGNLGIEMDIIPTNLYLSLQDLFPEKEIMDISPLIRHVRMIKSSYEISLIQKAAEMADRLFEHIPAFIQKSKTEIDLAAMAEAFYRKEGHPGLTPYRSFNMEGHYGLIIAGSTATVPGNSSGPAAGTGLGPYLSQGSGFTRIRKHEPILVDYASNVEGYLSDQTRIFSIGKLHERYYQAYSVMLEVQESIVREGKPGVRAGDLYDLAIRTVEKAGLAEGFMGYPDPVPFVAHGVGLEMDEWPLISKNSDHVLQEGMVFALEPKYTFPGEGIVGIENTFVMTRKGMEKLNQFPEDMVVC